MPLSQAARAGEFVPETDGLGFALRTALERNPAILREHAAMQAQLQGIAEARSGLYPRVSVQANNLNADYDSGVARLDQPLWTFGKLSNAIDRAQAGYALEKLTLLRLQRQLLEQTAVAYAQIQGILARAKVAQWDVEEHQNLYDRINRRMQGGLASEADVRLAYSRLIRSRLQQQSIQGDLEVARNELQAATIDYVPAERPVDAAMARVPARDETERLAILNSADVMHKRAEVEVARLDVERQQSAYKPDLYARVEQELLDTVPGQDKTRVGLVFESSFEGLGLAAVHRVKGASARLGAAKEDLQATLNDLHRNVLILLANRATREALIEAQTQSVQAVEDTMASFLRQYETGRKSWVEVLNTQSELAEQRFLLEQYRNEWLVYSLRLLSEIGALDDMAGVDPT